MKRFGQEDVQALEKMMIRVFNEGVNQLVIPWMQDLRAEMHEMREDISELKSDMTEVKGTLSEHTVRFDRLERVLRAETKTLDEHSIRLKKIEKHIGLR